MAKPPLALVWSLYRQARGNMQTWSMIKDPRFSSGVATLRKIKLQSAKFLSRLCTTQQWYLIYSDTSQGKVANLSRFNALMPPHGAFWADPFVAVRDGRCFVLFEEFRYGFLGCTRGGKGKLMAMERFPGNVWGESKLILERGYHLSYPFVFEWQDRFFLLPETSENRTIELYEEVEFPWKWRFYKTIMDGVSTLDTTLHQAGGRWWMFTCMRRDGVSNRDLHLFSAIDPISGNWEPHPLNPVVSDFCCARPAGAIFFDGRHWIRPGQDCSLEYGRAVEFRRILQLDESGYAEESAGRFGPDGLIDAAGVHTWNSAHGFQVADVRRNISRWHLLAAS